MWILISICEQYFLRYTPKSGRSYYILCQTKMWFILTVLGSVFYAGVWAL